MHETAPMDPQHTYICSLSNYQTTKNHYTHTAGYILPHTPIMLNAGLFLSWWISLYLRLFVSKSVGTKHTYTHCMKHRHLCMKGHQHLPSDFRAPFEAKSSVRTSVILYRYLITFLFYFYNTAASSRRFFIRNNINPS